MHGGERRTADLQWIRRQRRVNTIIVLGTWRRKRTNPISRFGMYRIENEPVSPTSHLFRWTLCSHWTRKLQFDDRSAPILNVAEAMNRRPNANNRYASASTDGASGNNGEPRQVHRIFLETSRTCAPICRSPDPKIRPLYIDREQKGIHEWTQPFPRIALRRRTGIAFLKRLHNRQCSTQHQYPGGSQLDQPGRRHD